MLRFGFDIHGVIDQKPTHYSKLIKKLKKNGVEIHIITGIHIDLNLILKLTEWDIYWDCMFSITDYHTSIGTKITYSNPENPHMDDEIWDRTKADYCKRKAIDIHFDDSKIYGKYFDDINTVYVLMNYKE